MLLFPKGNSQRCPVDARVTDDKHPHWVTVKADTWRHQRADCVSYPSPDTLSGSMDVQMGKLTQT